MILMYERSQGVHTDVARCNTRDTLKSTMYQGIFRKLVSHLSLLMPEKTFIYGDW